MSSEVIKNINTDKRFVQRIEVLCDFCGSIIYLTPNQEKKRRRNSKHSTITCSKNCRAKLSLRINPDHQKLMCEKASLSMTFEARSKLNRDIHLRKRTALSPFKLFLNGSRKKTSKSYGNLTLEYLKEIWEKQEGKCALTEVPMELRMSVTDVRKNSRTPLYGASLDRIDSNLGYNIGNVQFVCKGANLMKNNHTNQEALDFIKMIIEANNA